MDQTTDRSSSMVSSMPEEVPALDILDTYPSPVSATTPQGGFPLVGLGISNCGLEPTLNHSQRFPAPLSYSMPPAERNQLAAAPPFYNTFFKPLGSPEDPESFFATYDGFPGALLTPLDFYDSQTMSASTRYNSNLEATSSQDAFGHLQFWNHTPCSGSTTTMDPTLLATVPPTGLQPVLPQAPYCAPIRTSGFPIQTDISPSSPLDKRGKSSARPQSSPVRVEVYENSTTSGESGLDVSHKQPMKTCASSVESRRTNNKGYTCPTCGFTFTRKSNCKEHQKRHDPSFKPSFTCSTCEKSFGRKADLNRHVENVSQVYSALG
ncbi:hypothetical protein N7532_004913 [Penicillium argentinense]|uniref:C2H2-type domain-containing protein n=1 Tax=Penicillium argentinense TaxID=1131581 RepID=A0A9W9FDF7_9EURO|nr:uncharacterized protein N7532_004913 [Penicillium argentinense]KAJ5097912.1 hypothetical protein N7532_004913 [Penicillium argentinense]